MEYQFLYKYENFGRTKACQEFARIVEFSTSMRNLKAFGSIWPHHVGICENGSKVLSINEHFNFNRQVSSN